MKKNEIIILEERKGFQIPKPILDNNLKLKPIDEAYNLFFGNIEIPFRRIKKLIEYYSYIKKKWIKLE